MNLFLPLSLLCNMHPLNNFHTFRKGREMQRDIYHRDSRTRFLFYRKLFILRNLEVIYVTIWMRSLLITFLDNNEYWFCLNFHKINSVSKKNAYPLLNMKQHIWKNDILSCNPRDVFTIDLTRGGHDVWVSDVAWFHYRFQANIAIERLCPYRTNDWRLRLRLLTKRSV